MGLKEKEGNEKEMEKSRVTDKMIKYLLEHNISISEISEKTGVPEEKLKPGYSEALFAGEFLELCMMLRIRPEDFYE